MYTARVTQPPAPEPSAAVPTVDQARGLAGGSWVAPPWLMVALITAVALGAIFYALFRAGVFRKRETTAPASKGPRR